MMALRIDQILLNQCVSMRQYILNRLNLTTMHHQRTYTEEPLRNSHKPNKLHVPTSSYLKSFKKANANPANRENMKPRQDVSRKNIESVSSSKQNAHQVSQHGQYDRGHLRMRQPTQSSQSNGHDQIQHLMQETDNSMEELLNSSINQLEKLIIRQDDSCESLEDQNYRLKAALIKMKNILKGKLESALQKQKDELSKMLEDYISLITKLLQDKQELTITLQDIEEAHQRELQEREQSWDHKFKKLMQERDEHISSTKGQIQQFLQVIETYQEETKGEQNRFAQMQNRIDELEEERECLLSQIRNSNDESCQQTSVRIEAQSTKIQTLLELLEKAEQENRRLKEQVSQLKSKKGNSDDKQLREMYEAKLQELEQEHEEEFLQYERAIKDTISKKDECIERLNLIIEGLRERKCLS